MKPRVVWMAESDGIGHAHVGRGRVTRTACDQRAIDPRAAWPIRARCPICTGAVARLIHESAGGAPART